MMSNVIFDNTTAISTAQKIIVQKCLVFTIVPTTTTNPSYPINSFRTVTLPNSHITYTDQVVKSEPVERCEFNARYQPHCDLLDVILGGAQCSEIPMSNVEFLSSPFPPGTTGKSNVSNGWD